MDLYYFLSAHSATLSIKLLEQLSLVGISMGIAISIGVPIGIWLKHQCRWQIPILGVASVLQTIPSLALLGLLLPFVGIGTLPALIALSIYALLPIIRNTLLGLQSIPEEIKESADDLGSTRWQQIRLVDLPLALPAIMTGIRTATSMTVGIATLAAFIGAGGLGDFINQGLALNNMQLILLGAIPAALLALFLDGLLAYRHKIVGIITIALLILVAPFIKQLYSFDQKEPTLRIATKNFSEQLILGHLMAQVIEAHTNVKVERKFNLGSTAICQQAMLNGEIDLYPEYTGTAYLLVLKAPYKNQTPDELYSTVKTAYQQRFNLVWLSPFGFNNTQALAIRQEFAQNRNIKTITDLLKFHGTLKLGAPSEFIGRPDGLPGLAKTYQLKFASMQEFDPGLMYQAIQKKHVDVISAFSTDGRIPAYNLQILKDDRHLFPPYYAAPIIRQAVLTAYPEVGPALALLANQINDTVMQDLNYKVDLKKQDPAEVARNFLLEKKIIKNREAV